MALSIGSTLLPEDQRIVSDTFVLFGALGDGQSPETYSKCNLPSSEPFVVESEYTLLSQVLFTFLKLCLLFLLCLGVTVF